MICYAMDWSTQLDENVNTHEGLKKPVNPFGKRNKPAVCNWYKCELSEGGTIKASFLPDRSEGFYILNKKETAFLNEVDGATNYLDIGEKLGYSMEETEAIHEQLLETRIIREGRYVKELHSFTVVGAKEYGKAFSDRYSKVLSVLCLPVLFAGFMMLSKNGIKSYPEPIPLYLRILACAFSLIIMISFHEWTHMIAAEKSIETGISLIPLSGYVFPDEFDFSRTKRLKVLFAPVKMHLILLGLGFMFCSLSGLFAELFLLPIAINMISILTNLSMPGTDGNKMLQLLLDKNEQYKFSYFYRRRKIPKTEDKCILKTVSDMMMKIMNLTMKVLSYGYIVIILMEAFVF